MNMLMREGARPNTPLGMSLSETEYQPLYYPSEATMVYDPVHHDGLTHDQWRAQEKATRRYRPKKKFFKNAGAHVLASFNMREPLDVSPPTEFHESDKAARVRRFQKGIAITALIAAPFIINKVSALASWSDSHPQFNKVVEGVDNTENCVMFQATGFGTRNSDETARLIGPATSQYGDVYSLRYDNANFTTDANEHNTVDTDAITDAAEEVIDENGYTCVSGFGSSFGGLPITDMMGQLNERRPDVRQDIIGLDGVPVGSEAVYDNELRKGTFLMTALTSPWLSPLNGTITRGGIEFFQRYNSMYRCENEDLLGDCHISMEGVIWAISEAKKRMTSEAASNNLLGAQFWSIVVADLETSLRNVADQPRVNRPTIVYFRPADPTRDHTVRTELSQAQIGNLANKYELEYVVVMLPPPAGHANAGDATDVYIKAVNKVLQTVHPHQQVYQFDPLQSDVYVRKSENLPPRIIFIPEQPAN